MRTQEEIVKFMRDNAAGFFNFVLDDCIPFLDYAHAKEFLKEECSEDKWNEVRAPYTRDHVLHVMAEYMPFAWDKALNHRGLSSSRSTSHFSTWLWLLGDDEAHKAYEDTEYAMYGVPKLKFICEKFGFSMDDSEEAQRMSRGEPCTPGCKDGC